ncbi:low-density lipoprotein receptor-related protein 2-like [Anneissia japonica]|uniref:low-density lipoprotein receptor-related protein 2-like n=1 Tax=Anneissia japonica TaxID=1529436 RepID=UPI00142582A6|nr:low-density lipoprotein receptor-related protein 2-like [Anneissia japonica]
MAAASKSNNWIFILVLLLSLVYASESFVEKLRHSKKRIIQESAKIKQKEGSQKVQNERDYCDGFLCENNLCLPEHYVCDGTPDCIGGGDEQSCNFQTCRDDQFRCASGTCIERSWACDMVTDCPGDDDEAVGLCEDRQCRADEFKCKGGACLEGKWRCDGSFDCYHSDDEVGCNTCTTEQFKCSDNVCIPEHAVCDGYADCYDGEDEHQWCACGNGEFKCENGLCIPHDKICDGKKDCGYGGEDEGNCEACDSNEYRCNGNGKCIPISFLCDGLLKDCPNGDDEANCGCTKEQFECSDGTCIALSLVCDGTTHCSDDEAFCECAELEFNCNVPNRVCLPVSQACDGIPQCPNGDDEEGCPFTCGPPENFLCPDGTCLPSFAQCDGVNDCINSADERDCECKEDEFKCLSGDCIANRYLCNSYRDCQDGSDESAEVCTPEPIVGECPNVPAGTIGLCIYGCDSDNDCQHSKKCCFNGCGKECVHPIFPPKLIIKEGDCPALSAPYGAHQCSDLCLSDSDCPHLEKCCSNTCGKVCAEPAVKTKEIEEINTNELEEDLEEVKRQFASFESRFDWLDKTVSDILVGLGILQTEITDLRNHEHYYEPAPVHYVPPPTTRPPPPPPPENAVNGYPSNAGSRPSYGRPSYEQETEKPASNNHVIAGRPTNAHSYRPHKKQLNKDGIGEFKRRIIHWGKLLRSKDHTE